MTEVSGEPFGFGVFPEDRTLDVFSDCSWNRTEKFYTGAYIVGRGGEPRQVVLHCNSNMDAEMLASIAGLKAAACQRWEGQEIVVHSDLRDIRRILYMAKRGPAAELRWLLKECRAVIFGDANIYPELLTCHLHARIKAGICREHPLYQVGTGR